MRDSLAKLVTDTRSEARQDTSHTPEKKPSASLRLRDLTSVRHERFGYVLPDNPTGRQWLFLELSHAANLKADPVKRMDNIIEVTAPWLSSEEGENLKRRVLTERPWWGADDLGLMIKLTDEERSRLRIGTIRPFDMDEAARAERSQHGRRLYMRAYRQRKSAEAKKPRKSGRRDAILKILPAVMEVPVASLCRKLRGSAAFDRLKSPAALRNAVHRELRELEQRGILRMETRLPTAGLMPVCFVKRVRDGEEAQDGPRLERRRPAPSIAPALPIATDQLPEGSGSPGAVPSNEREYRLHFMSRLVEFPPGQEQALNAWFRSEARLRKTCGMAPYPSDLRILIENWVLR